MLVAACTFIIELIRTMTAVRKRRSEDSGLTQFSDNVPLANVQEKIRTLGLVETRRYLELAESTQPNNHHDEH